MALVGDFDAARKSARDYEMPATNAQINQYLANGCVLGEAGV